VHVRELTGRVVVVAGAEPIAGPIAAALQTAGARVALVSIATAGHDGVAVHFRTDPGEPDVWDRVAMHVEQHLGPVDAAVADASCADVVRDVFGTDLRRRGHGDVVVAAAADDPADVVRRVAGTQ